MSILNQEQIRLAVRERYGEVAVSDGVGCGCGPSCCSSSAATTVEELSRRLGYSSEEVDEVPEGANLGLGCGNPQAMAAIRPGEVVVDLGSGGGFDCFLAARQVGDNGRVIGVDMTAEMVAKARTNSAGGGYHNVEFRLGEIENLPVADASADVIISNCVINLSPDKARVFAEAYRVLKPGGRLAVSDIVALSKLPAAVQRDLDLYAGCVAGAATISSVEEMLQITGLTEIRVAPKDESRSIVGDMIPGADVGDYVRSATIEAVKPLD